MRLGTGVVGVGWGLDGFDFAVFERWSCGLARRLAAEVV